MTGLVWAGAEQVATSTVPVIDDETTYLPETELLQFVGRLGPLQGLLQRQRTMSARYRTLRSQAASAPYRGLRTLLLAQLIRRSHQRSHRGCRDR